MAGDRKQGKANGDLSPWISHCQTVLGHTAPVQGQLCLQGWEHSVPRGEILHSWWNMDEWLKLSLNQFHVVSFNEAVPPACLHTALPFLPSWSTALQALDPVTLSI